ncbi:MAG: formate dehydrogenase [Robiginitomaculum sp.]|nr:MAG: formate dehydrogenase [Robiginitomaculum sp.]
MTTRIYIPADMLAIALCADEVARAIAETAKTNGTEIEIIRTGSRGACWAEPLIEVETDTGRIAYGKISADDVPGLFAADFLGGGAHEKHLGLVDDISFLQTQQRHIFKSCGLYAPCDLASYAANGGFAGLRAALSMCAENIIDEVEVSGLRGRGGAAFPAFIKWRTVQGANGPQKYIVCNADEGDSGTFADRLIMESDPFLLIEGMVIAGLSTQADKGVIYLRSEYPLARRVLEKAITVAQEQNWLGADIQGSGKAFDISLFVGGGSYVCGEETALLESLEGKAGIVRSKPPLPALEGLHGQPTLIHNVLTLCAVPEIIAKGGDAHAKLGASRSAGTMCFQLAGDIKHGGLVEEPFGISLRALLDDFGGGTRTGLPIKAVQIGGPLGAYLPPSLFDTPLTYEAFAALGAGLGHGGIVVFNENTDMRAQARYAFEFCAHESCGKCTPCRIGAVRGAELLASDTPDLGLVDDLCEIMVAGSACAMGSMTPIPVQSAMKHFPDEFGARATQAAE